jgi:hypothetical protein
MANRQFRNVTYTPYVSPTYLEFGFQTKGAASPTIFYAGAGAYGAGTLPAFITSITRTGVGTFLITLADSFPNMVSAWAQANGLLTSGAVITAVNNVGTSSPVTVNLTTTTSGAAADIAAGANNIIWVGLGFLNSWSS